MALAEKGRTLKCTHTVTANVTSATAVCMPDRVLCPAQSAQTQREPEPLPREAFQLEVPEAERESTCGSRL